MKGHQIGIIFWLIAICLFIVSDEKPFGIKSPSEIHWDRIRACIARSQKILNDEAMKSHRLIDWDDVTPEQIDDRRKLLSRLNVEKIDRDSECRAKYSF